MAEHGLFATSDLVPLLAERGIHLSREQVYRLVTTPPQRLSMDVLAALSPARQPGGGRVSSPASPRRYRFDLG